MKLNRSGEKMSYDDLGARAFINCDSAACRYEPHPTSAVRVIPPYGTLVDVLKDEGEWVQIMYATKSAWAVRSQLSTEKPGPNKRFDISPYLFRKTTNPFARKAEQEPQIEFGPRGGRFTRTRTGFKRYF